MAASAGYPDSYYAATANPLPPFAPLQGAVTADVCVIGGGFTGVSAALNLAEKGYRVVLLEAERIGFGASGRCGGLIGSGQRKDVLELEELFGFKRAKAFWDFAEAAKDEIRSRVAEHSIDCDLQSGQLEGVHKPGYLDWATEYADALAERYDYPHCRALDKDEAQALVASPTFPRRAVGRGGRDDTSPQLRAGSRPCGCRRRRADTRELEGRGLFAQRSGRDNDVTGPGQSRVHRACLQRLSRQAGTASGEQDHAD